jgi:excisionase family DNA binding protein
MTTKQAAEKWGISDRRVRVLCGDGKIPGAVKDGKSYKIPMDAVKPADGRKSPAGRRSPARREKAKSADVTRWLKWENEIVGTIDSTNAVHFVAPTYNEVVKIYTESATEEEPRSGKLGPASRWWSPEQFAEFLSERVVSRDRRDIERILFRCGLSNYDVLRIAEITRGIHPKDLLWVAHSESERLEAVMTDVFDAVFHQRIDLIGDSIDTPEGYNIKRYGVYNAGNPGGSQYGIYKQRISPLTTDVESEVAVYLLAQKLGVPCCPAYRVDKETVFSAFLYDFSQEYIVHFRRLFDGPRSDNEYQNLLAVRPQYKDDIARMILLDLITRQDDRHLSNIAIKMSGNGESFYPLYDNGRSLFYEDTEEMVRKAVADPAGYATGFGYAGTYWDYVQEIAAERGDLGRLLNLNINKSDVTDILKAAGFAGYRLDGAREWVVKAVEMIRAIA